MEDNPITNTPDRNETLSAKTYVVICAAGLIVSIVLLLMFVVWAPALVRDGIDGRVFYFLLFPLALSTVAFIFGAMRSFAKFSGQVLSGALELGGPIVGAGLVVIGGFYLVPSPSTTFNLTIRIHDQAGNPIKAGNVALQLGQDTRQAPIAPNGEANIKEIPIKFRTEQVKLLLEIPGYKMPDPAQKVSLTEGILDVGVIPDEKADQQKDKNSVASPPAPGLVESKLILQKFALASSGYQNASQQKKIYVQTKGASSNRLLLNIGLTNPSSNPAYIHNVSFNVVGYAEAVRDIPDDELEIASIKVDFQEKLSAQQIQQFQQEHKLKEKDHYQEIYTFATPSAFTSTDLQAIKNDPRVTQAEALTYGTGHSDILPSKTLRPKTNVSPTAKLALIETDKGVAPHGFERFDVALGFAKTGTYVLQGKIRYDDKELQLPQFTVLVRY